MPDLRTALADALSSAEEVSPPESIEAGSNPVSPPDDAVAAPAAPAAPADDRPRDDSGRFVAKESAPAASVAAAVAAATPAQVAPVAPVAPEVAPVRPSTWKKEYWPLYDKLAGGQPLTAEEARKLADYTNERENQFKAGVSTYKAEADRAKEIWDAIAPFQPDLQRYGIQPGKWIANLAAAHKVLAFGSPAEKAQMVSRLAAEYQVPIDQLGQAPQLDPNTKWLADQVAALQGKISQYDSLQQQREQQQLSDMVTRVRDERDQGGKLLRPHFETVREQMAGLLSSGFAQSLEDAYTKAVRLNDDLYREQATQLAPQGAQAAAVVAKAKAAAISPKSASPRGTDDAQPKGRRDAIAAQVDSFLGSGRV